MTFHMVWCSFVSGMLGSLVAYALYYRACRWWIKRRTVRNAREWRRQVDTLWGAAPQGLRNPLQIHTGFDHDD